MTLEAAVKEFEATFSEVIDGLAGPMAQNGEKYIEVASGGRRGEGEELEYFDTPEQAIQSWLSAVKPFSRKKKLYWRIRPELGQFGAIDKSDQNYKKWTVYSRFLSTDLT